MLNKKEYKHFSFMLLDEKQEQHGYDYKSLEEIIVCGSYKKGE